MSELVPVEVGPCACPPPSGHTSDIVYLRPALSLMGGLEAQRENSRALSEAILEVLGTAPTDEQLESLKDENAPLTQRVAQIMNELLVMRWVPVFIRHGAVAWNLELEGGKARPFDPQVLLDDFNLGRPVADAAADLYADALMRPLVARLASPSQPTPIDGIQKGTRPTRSSTRKRRSSSPPRGSAGTRSARNR